KTFGCALIFLILLLVGATALADYPFLLTAGGSFAYSRDDQGKLMVYGDNQFGQLGKGSKAQSKKPAEFKSKNENVKAEDIRDIYAGSDYSFFLMKNGDIYGVGRNFHNALLAGSNRTYITTHQLIPLEDKTVVKLACGFGQTLALNEAGEVWTWGYNGDGQLGTGSTKQLNEPYKLPLTDIVDIAAGGKFSLALDKNGVLWGWGSNSNHQLSPSKEARYLSPMQIELGDIKPAFIDAGGATVAVVDEDGALYMWGRNDAMQIGVDTKGKDVTEPRRFDELPLPVTFLDSYNSQTYVILTDGSLWGWGNNQSGQLGLGKKTKPGSPVSMIWEKDVIYVTSFDVSMNCVLSDGTVLAAGSNKFGQFGASRSDFHIPQIQPNGVDLILGDGES
ncbi:MAG: hypothetical protein IJ240_05830, partial [Clostridia bacterium]|nr:hypothetical protein [Clostridia bacterium]